jgi:hypothetical protein
MSGKIAARFGTGMWRGLERQITSLGRITMRAVVAMTTAWGPVEVTRGVESGAT